MLMFGIITSLHGMSPLATYGLGSIFYLLLAVIGFLIPAGLVAAELGTGWPRDGGVYVWVTEAFGSRLGFLAAWLQWFQNIIFWTVILASSAAMVALSFGWDGGMDDKPYAVLFVLGSIWFVTLLTILGLRASGWVSTVGSLFGTIAPGVALIGLAIAFVATGHPSNMSFAASDLVPDMSKPSNLTFGISTIVIFAGIELMATRVAEVKNAGRTYPRATWLAIAMTTALLIPAVLSISILVPHHELSIIAGIVQAVRTIFTETWTIPWLVPVFAIAIWVDSVGEIAGWMVGTPVAMATATVDGHLPPRFSATSERGVATSALIAQALIGSLISVLFIVEPTVSNLFWVLSALLVQLYLMMYILVFAAALRLRSTRPDVVRPFRIPLGWFGIWVVCGAGILFSVAAFVVGFFPPAGLALSTFENHLLVLIVAIALFTAIPLLISWKRGAPADPVVISYKLQAGDNTAQPSFRVMQSNSHLWPAAQAHAQRVEGTLTILVTHGEVTYDRRFGSPRLALDAHIEWLVKSTKRS